MYIPTERHADVAAVYLNTNTFWYTVVGRSFHEVGESFDKELHEWVTVYGFDYRPPRAGFNEHRSMTVLSTSITAVQEA